MGIINLPMGKTWQDTLTNWKRVLEYGFTNLGSYNISSLPASKVDITDSADYFTNSDAENVLAELGSRWLSSTALPVASSGYTRKFVYIANPSKTADTVHICYKTSDDNFAWHQII